MIKVSVIVPVYNQEKYIERCIDSILAQSLQEIEVILVDDGSTDATADILSHYEQKDERITVLHQQNQYAGVARNHGLQIAKGEYVIFWDSDDYFAVDALEVLYYEIQRWDADICVGDAVKMDLHRGSEEEKVFLHWDRIPEKRPFNIHDIPQYIFNFAKNYPWNRLYKRSFLVENNLQFSKLKQSNDVFFVMKAFVLADKITVTDKIIVYYQFRNAGSLSGNAWKKKENALKAHLEVKDFLVNSGYWDNQDIRCSFINNAFGTISSQFTMVEDPEEYKALFEFYKEKALPALGIADTDIEKMNSEKNKNELSCMLTCDAEEYIFKQYMYFLRKSRQYRDRTVQLKSRLKKSHSRIAEQKEKIELQKDRIGGKNERIQKQNEKIQKQKERIQRQSEKLQQQSEKLQSQSGQIRRQGKKLQSQQELLDRKLVKAALKVQNIFLG